MEFSAARISFSVPLWTARTSGQSCTACKGTLHIGHAVVVLPSSLTVALPGPLAPPLRSPLTVAWPNPLAPVLLFSPAVALPGPLALALRSPLTVAGPNPLAPALLFSPGVPWPGPLAPALRSPLTAARPDPPALAPLCSPVMASPGPLAPALCSPPPEAWPGPLAPAPRFLLTVALPGPLALARRSLLTVASPGLLALALSDSELLLLELELELDEPEEGARLATDRLVTGMRKLFSGPSCGTGPRAGVGASENRCFGGCARPAGSLSAGLFLDCSAAGFWDGSGAAARARLEGGRESAGFSRELISQMLLGTSGQTSRAGLLTP